MNLEDRIESYWSKRSDKFYDLRVEELNSDKRKLWEDEIISNLPDKENLKIPRRATIFLLVSDLWRIFVVS